MAMFIATGTEVDKVTTAETMFAHLLAVNNLPLSERSDVSDVFSTARPA